MKLKFLVPTTVLLLTVSLPLSLTQSCSKNTTASPRLSYNGGGLAGFFNLAVSFLNGIRGPFPYDAVKTLVQTTTSSDQPSSTELQNAIKPVVGSQAGFLVCLIIGLLWAFLMPWVGFCFCCCRLCNNCGGRKEQPKPTTSCFVVLVVLFLVIFVMMLTGVVLLSVSWRASYFNAPTAAQNSLDQVKNLSGFLQKTSDELVCELNKIYTNVVTAAINLIESFADMLVNIINSLGNFDPVFNLTTAAASLQTDLATLSTSLTNLGNQAATLSSNFTDLNQAVNNKYSNNPVNSTQLTAVQNELQFYYNGSQALANATGQFSVDIQALDLNSTSNITYYQEVLKNFTLQIRQITADAESTINSTSSTVKNVTNIIKTSTKTIQDTITNYTNQYGKYLHTNLNTYREQYGFTATISLIYLWPILIALLCGAIGFVCGAAGYKARTHPTQRSYLSNCGGDCLLASVGFMFIFGWIFMLLTVIIFFISYGFQLVCYPLFEDPSFKLYGSIGDYVNLTFPIGINGGDDMYYTADPQRAVQGCKDNQAIYTAFGLGSLADPFLNQTKDQLTKSLNSIDINQINSLITADLVYLIPAAFNDSIHQLNQTSWAVQALGSAVGNVTTAPKTTIQSMQQLIAFLQSQTSSSDRTAIIQQWTQVNSSLQLFTSLQSSVRINYNKIQSDAVLLQQALSQIVVTVDVNKTVTETKAAAQKIIDQLRTIVIQNLDILVSDLKTDIARCGDLYNTWQNMGTVLCKLIAYPFFGAYLGLGWILFFFIPAVCVSVRLAKYFRKMKYPEMNQYGSYGERELGVRNQGPKPTPWTNNQVQPAQQNSKLNQQNKQYDTYV